MGLVILSVLYFYKGLNILNEPHFNDTPPIFLPKSIRIQILFPDKILQHHTSFSISCLHTFFAMLITPLYLLYFMTSFLNHKQFVVRNTLFLSAIFCSVLFHSSKLFHAQGEIAIRE